MSRGNFPMRTSNVHHHSIYNFLSNNFSRFDFGPTFVQHQHHCVNDLRRTAIIAIMTSNKLKSQISGFIIIIIIIYHRKQNAGTLFVMGSDHPGTNTNSRNNNFRAMPTSPMTPTCLSRTLESESIKELQICLSYGQTAYAWPKKMTKEKK